MATVGKVIACIAAVYGILSGVLFIDTIRNHRTDR